jgi:hypothetical protein
MVASHPKMFRPSTVDKDDLNKLVDSHLLPSRAILEWRPAKDEVTLTPNTNEIVVSIAFF